MPEDSCRVLVYPKICGHIDGIILNHRPTFVVPLRSEKPPDLGESCEAPIAFFGVEAMVRSWWDHTYQHDTDGFLLCSLTVHYVYRRVMLVPHNQAELDTSVPTLRRLLISIFVALFEVEGREVDVVSKRK